MGLQEERRALPIYSARGALLREIRANRSCVIVGETGSGKTTQIPQYLLEAGLARKRGVACTQPRRVAAVSIARRVAEERGAELGKEVGYSVRFDDCSSQATRLKFMTDGMLLREAISDPLLLRYGVVILDEAHERTVHTDILFGVVKAAQREREEGGRGRLKIVVMSATLAAERFSTYFDSAKILYIQGRQYPVKQFYTATPQTDYLHAAIVTVLQLHGQQEAKGDILVFLTGREEIESTQALLEQCRQLLPPDWTDLLICPLYAALPGRHQQKVLLEAPKGFRKVILSTNIAETSLTIPGVRYVIDTGMVKARGYNPHIGLDLLCVQPVSKAQARQRAGRAAREAQGYCYRLYPEEAFCELPEETVPEIQRSPLSSVVLQLLAMGVGDILGFDFMDAPSEEALVRALEQLYLLGAVEMGEGAELTALGRKIAHFPLDPHLAKAIIVSQDYGCVEDVLSIVSLLSVDSVLFTPQDRREEAAAVRHKFTSPSGDHLTLLNTFRAYKAVRGNKTWCRENFVHVRNMRTVMDVRSQLHDLCHRVGVALGSSGNDDVIRQSLLAGLFMNAAEHIGEGRYRTVGTKQEVHIHPSSTLFHAKPPPACVMFSELVYTTRCYMRAVSVISLDWLTDAAPLYFKRTS